MSIAICCLVFIISSAAAVTPPIQICNQQKQCQCLVHCLLCLFLFLLILYFLSLSKHFLFFFFFTFAFAKLMSKTNLIYFPKLFICLHFLCFLSPSRLSFFWYSCHFFFVCLFVFYHQKTILPESFIISVLLLCEKIIINFTYFLCKFYLFFALFVILS